MRLQHGCKRRRGSQWYYYTPFTLYIRFQTGCTTGLTTGLMFVYAIQPVVQPVVNPFDNRFDNRLYRVNGVLGRISVLRRPTYACGILLPAE